MQPLAFIDLETTGATITSDRITEIGVVEVDEHGMRQWSQLINPGTRIPEFIQGLTGITNEMVAEAPPFEAIAESLRTRLMGRLFIAHNARFDYGFLKQEFKRAGLEFRATVLCTVKLSRKLFPQHHRHSLDSLIERHGLRVEGRHRALADAQLIHQFWERIHAELPADDVMAAIKQLTARPSLPAHLDPDLADVLPTSPGVYLFYGENNAPLYVGKASNLRKRVLSHFAADHTSAKEMSLASQVRHIDWLEMAGEIGAALQEARLVKSLQPSHNRQLRQHGELCTWQLVQVDTHYVPRLVFDRDQPFAAQAGCYGLFKSARDARRSLQALADEHGLCRAVLELEQVKPGQPCFAYQVQKCRGACVGRESLSFHTARLMAVLARLKLQAWPFPGAAMLEEGETLHVIDRWCYLGSLRQGEELEPLLSAPRPSFDQDIYKILLKSQAKMKPLRVSPAIL